MSGYLVDDARKVTTHRLIEMKQQGKKIAMLTAYDYTMAQIVDQAGMDLIKGGREDLIGYDEKCLIAPRKSSAHKTAASSRKMHKDSSLHQKDRQKKQKKRSPIRNIHKKKS